MNRRQVLAIGVLPVDVGLQAMSAVMSSHPTHSGVLGSVPQAYWNMLTQSPQGVPELYSELDLSASATAHTGSAPQVLPAQPSSSASAGSSSAQGQHPAGMDLEAVEGLVKNAAEELLGQELDGVCCCCRCRHHSSLSSCINSARATPRVPQAQASSRLVALTA